MAKTLPKRQEVEEKYKWRLEDIFPTDDDWEKEFEAIQQFIPQVEQFQQKLGESADTLYRALQTKDELSMRLGKLYVYAHMRNDEDTGNNYYQALHDRAALLATEISSKLSFFLPELLAIPEETLSTYIESHEGLQLYRQTFKEINEQRRHVLEAEQEKILAEAGDVIRSSSNTFGMLNNADLTFPTIKDADGEEVAVTHGRYTRLMESEDRRVRHDAFKAVYDTYGAFKNTFSSTLSGTIKKDNFYAKVRKYNTARHAALSNNHIPEKVYDQLIEVIHERMDLMYRYVALRKKALGLDELHMYDLYTPMVKEVEYKVTYEEAKEIILKGLHPLGEEYRQILTEAFENGWIDVVENVGKRSGAYSSGTYGTNPYILLNWQDNVNNLFTLAHELGHSVHSYYTRKFQPYPYGDYSIFVAEVASTCNEALLNDYLLKTETDKKKKLYLLNHYLETFRATVYRQTMFAEFEHLMHEQAANGTPLTAEKLTELYYDLNKLYFGKDIVIDKEIGLEWARIPHFYYNYYVYQYATGFSAATALSNQILTEGEPAVRRYIDHFLKAGSSDYPIEVLKRAGVDMTEKEPIQQALDVFEQRLNEMEQLLGELK